MHGQEQYPSEIRVANQSIPPDIVQLLFFFLLSWLLWDFGFLLTRSCYRANCSLLDSRNLLLMHRWYEKLVTPVLGSFIQCPCELSDWQLLTWFAALKFSSFPANLPNQLLCLKKWLWFVIPWISSKHSVRGKVLWSIILSSHRLRPPQYYYPLVQLLTVFLLWYRPISSHPYRQVCGDVICPRTNLFSPWKYKREQ